MNNSQVPGQVVRDYCKRWRDTPDRGLARKIMADHPVLFDDYEECRRRVRYYRGHGGNADRKSAKDKNLFVPLKTRVDYGLPAEENIEYLPHELTGSKILVISDVHLPYHSNQAIMACFEACRRKRIDTVLLNGDIMDAYQLSKFCRDPRKRDWKGEIEIAKIFLQAIRKFFPKSKIVYKEGNHERRYEDYVKYHAPELFGIKEYRLEKLLHLDDISAEWVGEKRIIRVDKVSILHGDEYGSGTTNPVNPARGFFLRAKSNTILGHFHQSSEHTETNILGEVITCWSTGCMCYLHPQYMPLNRWCHGFLTIIRDGGKKNIVNHRIINGKVY